MPGTRCTVAVCNNSFEKTKRAGMNIMYHQFPKAQPFRNMWIERCRRAGKWNPNSCHVCSIHFREDDYKKDSSYEVLNLPGKKRLKSTAVPSLFLTEPPPLTLVTLTQKKKKLESPRVKQLTCFNNDNTIYLQLDDSNIQNESTDQIPTYEIHSKEDSDDKTYLAHYGNNHDKVEHPVNDLELCYIGEKKIERIDETDEEYSEESKPQFIIVHDSSTQTDTDYFLENYKLLVKRNESLENELVRWGIRYQKLLSNMRLLESELDRLKLNSRRMQQ